LLLCLGLQAQSILPAPKRMVAGDGAFILGPNTRIVAEGAALPLGERLRDDLKRATGLPLLVLPKGDLNAIHLRLDPKAEGLGAEGYVLEATAKGVEIRAQRLAGLFYGIQSLRQLLPAEVFREASVPGVAWKVPVTSIEDAPRFAWRGSHLDVGR